MISKTFKNMVKTSFRMARNDVDRLRNSTDEWVRFLDAERHELKQQIVNLSRRIAELESGKILN